jgi:hypothetical protein
MLIAFDGSQAVAIQPNVTVWVSSDGHLNLDDGRIYPQYINVDTVEPDGTKVGRFYEMMGMMHMNLRAIKNQDMPVSKIWYQCLKEDKYGPDGKFKGAWEPWRDYKLPLKAHVVREYVEACEAYNG